MYSLGPSLQISLHSDQIIPTEQAACLNPSIHSEKHLLHLFPGRKYSGMTHKQIYKKKDHNMHVCVCWKEIHERMGRSWVLKDNAIYLLFYWLSSCYRFRCDFFLCVLSYTILSIIRFPCRLVSASLCASTVMTPQQGHHVSHSLNPFLTLSRFSWFFYWVLSRTPSNHETYIVGVVQHLHLNSAQNLEEHWVHNFCT